MLQDLTYKTASELSQLLSQKAISSVDLLQSFIRRAERLDPTIQAFLSQQAPFALEQAKASDERRSKGQSRGPLDGIPVSLKDLIAVQGQPLTCASKILKNFISPYDATVTSRLKAQGAVLWGRMNMDEFAMGSSNENSSVKPCFNPWNTAYSPGGSSGGSAAAVAACMTPLALGSDTGGSIRQPAALCGVLGLKPTYGLVSRYGLAAFASSLDQIGPLGRSVEDIALILNALAGHDPKDSTSYPSPTQNYLEGLKTPKKRTIGIAKEYFSEGLDKDVREALEKAIRFYEGQGHRIEEVSLPHNTDLAIAIYYIIAPAEASSNLARYDGIRYGYRAEGGTPLELHCKTRGEGFGAEVKRRILLGTYMLSSGYYDAYYLKAQKIRSLIRQDFEKAFAKVDVLLTPTTPSAGLKIGEKVQDPLKMYLNDIYTVSANLAGIPGLSMPCGISPESQLPIGLQLLGKPFSEKTLLNMAYPYEEAHPYKNLHPKL